MTEQEARQAQTVARIRRHVELYPEDERPDMLKSSIISLLEIVDSQAQKIESAQSIAKIATDRFFQAKQAAEKYRNAYVYANARKDGHHPKSLIQAELLPWERWDKNLSRIDDLTEIEKQ